jgi:hypothetical protein
MLHKVIQYVINANTICYERVYKILLKCCTSNFENVTNTYMVCIECTCECNVYLDIATKVLIGSEIQFLLLQLFVFFAL